MTGRPDSAGDGIGAVYLDHQATTPVDPVVAGRMAPWFAGLFGNPHSRHRHGSRAEAAVNEARAQVAALIGANPHEVVFTSGATEANNLAIKGVMRAARASGRDHLVTAATEHPSVLACCRRLERDGVRVTVLPVDPGGLVDPRQLSQALTPRTALVSIMTANHEIGTVQPIGDLAAVARNRGVPFHTDAVQAAGRIPVDVRGLGVDLVSLCAHKMYGPPGIGALWVSRAVALEPLMDGGGQERGLRPGTVPVPLAVGFGAAAELAAAAMPDEARRLAALGDRLLDRLASGIEGLRVNGLRDGGREGVRERRLPGTLSVVVPGVDAADLMDAVPDVAMASGAACAAGSDRPSHVLEAIGLGPLDAACSLRLGAGRFTTEAEIDTAAARLVGAALRLRRESPA